MFSALKFIAAGVVVALFGGFVLTGVLTTQQGDEMAPAAATTSPSPAVAVTDRPTLEATSEPTETIVRTDILPGVALVTEEVQPGVLRIVSDGVRDLSQADFWLRTDVSRDGGVWGHGSDGLFRFGDARAYRRGDRVTPDGAIWQIDVERTDEPGASDWKRHLVIRSHDGEAWTVHKTTRSVPRSLGRPDTALDVAPDGTVWAAWAYPDQKKGASNVTVGWFSDDGWQPLETPIKGRSEDVDLAIADSGDVGLRTILYDGTWSLYRYVEGAWEQSASRPDSYPSPLRDGTWWWPEHDDDKDRWAIGSFDGSAWDEVELPGGGDVDRTVVRTPVMAPDGSAWAGLGAHGGAYDDSVRWCGKNWIGDGIGRFDGQRWDRYLRGHCLMQIEFTRDGSAWVVASEGHDYEGPAPTQHLYVIQPEAAAAGS